MAALNRFNPYFNYIDLSLGAEDQCDCEGEEAGNYENGYDEKEVVATPSYQAEENQPEQLKEEEEQIVQSPIENQAKEEEREEIEPPAPEPRIEEEEKKKKKKEKEKEKEA
jgi:hypothetical protein